MRPNEVRQDIKLSTGRIIRHTRMPNGAQDATPTTGDIAMTHAEWAEYCAIVLALHRGK